MLPSIYPRGEIENCSKTSKHTNKYVKRPDITPGI